MIGYFLLEGLYCAQHDDGISVPTAVILANKLVDVSPAARLSGAKPGQTKRQAHLCSPDILFFEYDEARYKSALKIFLDRCYGLTPVIEPDNAKAFFADFGGGGLADEPLKVLGTLFDTESIDNISVCAGFAPQKFLARSISAAIADRAVKARSAGKNLLWLYADEEHVGLALSKLPLKYLWSLDSAERVALELLGFHKMADIAKMGSAHLVYRYGKRGRTLYLCSAGLDKTAVLPLYPPRSVKAKKEIGCAWGKAPEMWRLLSEIAAEIGRRLDAEGSSCQRIELRVGAEGGKKTFSRDSQQPIRGAKRIERVLVRLYEAAMSEGAGSDFAGALEAEASALTTRITSQPLLCEPEFFGDKPGSTFEKSMSEIKPAMRALENKYGSTLVCAGKDLLDEESWRESMLAYWDPIRWRVVVREQDN